MNVIARKFTTFVELLRLHATDFLATRSRVGRNPGTLLVVKLDAIGDYILFRNFLEILKKHHLYRKYQVTLCGNLLWKDLAETLDSPYVDDFIWIDRKKFYQHLEYRSAILTDISRRGFEVVVQSSYSREYFFCDAVVRASHARVKIGNSGDTQNITKKAKFHSDRYYDQFITLSGSTTFEFYRNREFFEKLLKTVIELPHPNMDVSGITTGFTAESPYAVLFPGAGERFRCWSVGNFAEIADFLFEKYGMQVLIAGSKADSSLADGISAASKCARPENITGKTPLPELAKIIAGAELLVANDTGAVHLAVAVGTRVVCISNGNHFGRFHPYPDDTRARSAVVYPSVIMENLGNPVKLYAEYGRGSSIDIQTIPVSQVKQVINDLLCDRA